MACTDVVFTAELGTNQLETFIWFLGEFHFVSTKLNGIPLVILCLNLDQRNQTKMKYAHVDIPMFIFLSRNPIHRVQSR